MQRCLRSSLSNLPRNQKCPYCFFLYRLGTAEIERSKTVWLLRRVDTFWALPKSSLSTSANMASLLRSVPRLLLAATVLRQLEYRVYVTPVRVRRSCCHRPQNSSSSQQAGSASGTSFITPSYQYYLVFLDFLLLLGFWNIGN